MTRAATASRSAVVTPGTAASRHAFSASATTRPASRIFRICSGVLISTMALRGIGLGAQGVRGALRHLGDGAQRGDGDDQALLGEVADDGLGLAVVDLEADAHGLLGVVAPLVELAAALVADAVALRGVVDHVVDVAAVLAAQPAPGD